MLADYIDDYHIDSCTVISFIERKIESKTKEVESRFSFAQWSLGLIIPYFVI